MFYGSPIGAAEDSALFMVVCRWPRQHLLCACNICLTSLLAESANRKAAAASIGLDENAKVPQAHGAGLQDVSKRNSQAWNSWRV